MRKYCCCLVSLVSFFIYPSRLLLSSPVIPLAVFFTFSNPIRQFAVNLSFFKLFKLRSCLNISIAFIILLISFFSTNISAQEKIKREAVDFPQLSLRTSLTSYLDEDAGIMLGANYRWTEKFSVSFEPTYIFYSPYLQDNLNSEIVKPIGYKFRTDIKYHFPQRIFWNMEVFIASEFHYKFTRTKRSDVFGINCIGGNCAYFQNARYTETKKETGGLLKVGVIAPIASKKNDRWFLELYGGFGYKQMKFKETDLPVGGSFTNPPTRNFLNFTGSTNRNDFSYPMLPGGLKLIFILK